MTSKGRRKEARYESVQNERKIAFGENKDAVNKLVEDSNHEINDISQPKNYQYHGFKNNNRDDNKQVTNSIQDKNINVDSSTSSANKKRKDRSWTNEQKDEKQRKFSARHTNYIVNQKETNKTELTTIWK